MCVLSSQKKEGVLEFERPRFLASSSNRVLASTGTISDIVAFEVVDSTLRVDTVRSEPKTWFASV